MQNNTGGLTFGKFIPGILWSVFVLVLLCLPGEEIPDMDNWFSRFHIDKIIHFFLFSVMGYLFMAPPGRADFTDRKKMIIFILIGASVCAWGLVTEFIQKNFIPGRSFELSDWISDTCGSILAIITARIRFLNP